jgi:hypothetical protein
MKNNCTLHPNIFQPLQPFLYNDAKKYEILNQMTIDEKILNGIGT